MTMIFYPSEAFILGLFILLAIMCVLAVVATLNYYDFGDTTDYNVVQKLRANNLRKKLRVFVYVLTVLAFAAGLQSSFLPLDIPTVEITDISE